MNAFINIGDVSPIHGQTWIDTRETHNSDYVSCVEVLGGSDVGIADNQFIVRHGSIPFIAREWNSALSCIGFDTFGPPEYLDVVHAFNAYCGIEDDIYYGYEVVQVGKVIDDYTASGTTEDNPDVILHGNASFTKYLHANHLV